jgi:hypothetical protein
MAASDAAVYVTEDYMAARKGKSKSARSKLSRTTRSSSAKRGAIASKIPSLGPVAKPTSTILPAARVSKKEMVLGMLQESDGTSLAAIMAATGWQEHSVRGFFAAIVKKKLKLNLISRKVGDVRIYQVENPDPER